MITCSKCKTEIPLIQYAYNEYCPTCREYNTTCVVRYAGPATTWGQVPMRVTLSEDDYTVVVHACSALCEGGWIVVETFSFGRCTIDGFDLERFAEQQRKTQC